jgi:hypothetical protein
MIFGLLVKKGRSQSGQGNNNTEYTEKHHVLYKYQVAFFLQYLDRHCHVLNHWPSCTMQINKLSSAPKVGSGTPALPVSAAACPARNQAPLSLDSTGMFQLWVGSCGLANDNVFQAKLHRK